MPGKLFATVLTLAMASSSSIAFASSELAPSFATTASTHSLTRSLTMGTGATFEWDTSLARTDGTAERSEEGADNLTFNLQYHDNPRYFGNATEVMATITVTTHVVNMRAGYSSKPVSTTFETVLAKENTAEFVGAFKAVLPRYDAATQTVIENVSIAFHAGDKWDSNLGANYNLGPY